MSRLQLALNVDDLEGAVAFYSTLFGTPAHKRRPGYANFAIQDPPLKLVLIEAGPGERGNGTTGALNHLGVEVADTAEVLAAAGRLAGAGMATRSETGTVCCYAQQDKVWVHDPDGAPWEVYTVTDDDPAAADTDPACCTADTGQAGITTAVPVPSGCC